MAYFLARYREPHTRLPAPSWDLWEERRGIAAFTIGSVWAGLNAAANFTDAFGETVQAEKYRRAASEIKDGASRFLFDEKSGRFARSINVPARRDHRMTLDASMAGLCSSACSTPTIRRSWPRWKAMIAGSRSRPMSGGLARYRAATTWFEDVANVAGNP
jgi:GH15 family glucan-1,4-alpha-glucosidase